MTSPNLASLSMSYRVLRWYLGRQDVEPDIVRVVMGGPLAIVGGKWDDAVGFAERLAPERAVLDLNRRVPPAREVRELFAAQPDAIVIAELPEQVITSIGLIAQPWYMSIASLSSRPGEAVDLLREAIAQLGVEQPLELLGADVVGGLGAYPWPRGLNELREASRRIAAWIESGNLTAAAKRLQITRQAVTRYVARRT